MFPAQGCPHPSCALSLAGNRNIWEQAAYLTKFGAQNSETETAEGHSHCQRNSLCHQPAPAQLEAMLEVEKCNFQTEQCFGKRLLENGDGPGKKERLGRRFFASIRDFCLGINEMRFYSCILSYSMTAADFFLLSPRRLRSSGEI